MINYRTLPTEQKNPLSDSLDTLPIEKIIDLMNKEDQKISQAVIREKKNIFRAIQMIVKCLKSGGRMFFVGAGTSGRLGVIESAELLPTFSISPHLAQAVMAGGKKAVFKSQEGAEDNIEEAKKIVKRRVKEEDGVIGIASSGVTPFVKSAISESKKIGAKTILLTCNPRTSFHFSDIVIAPNVGPEIISGSTRLKSGTATKMVLNMLTTISMVQLGKVYKNRMVDLQPKSKKLRERGIALVQDLAEVSRKKAIKNLTEADWSVKTAILMSKKDLNYKDAIQTLKKHQGFLSYALESIK